MPQNITKSAQTIVREAMAEVPAISVEDALPLLNSDGHVFVDKTGSNTSMSTATTFPQSTPVPIEGDLHLGRPLGRPYSCP